MLNPHHSSLFSSVGLQSVICLHRKVALHDHKLVYWISGGLAALSVLLEKKSKRSELALYVLPRAGDSLWNILINRNLLPHIKNAEVNFNLNSSISGFMSIYSYVVYATWRMLATTWDPQYSYCFLLHLLLEVLVLTLKYHTFYLVLLLSRPPSHF